MIFMRANVGHGWPLTTRSSPTAADTVALIIQIVTEKLTTSYLPRQKSPNIITKFIGISQVSYIYDSYFLISIFFNFLSLNYSFNSLTFLKWILFILLDQILLLILIKYSRCKLCYISSEYFLNYYITQILKWSYFTKIKI